MGWPTPILSSGCMNVGITGFCCLCPPGFSRKKKKDRRANRISLGSLAGERNYTHSNDISGPLARQFCLHESVVAVAVLSKV